MDRQPALPPQSAHVISRSGSPVHAWVCGPESGPLIAWSHGATMDHRMFDAQLSILVEAGYRVLTWDVRGHGQSKPIGEVPMRMADMAEDLLAILDSLGESGPLCFGGQSMGGYIAQQITRDFPERVQAMILIGSTSITAPISKFEEWALRSSPWWFAAWPWGNLKRLMVRSIALRPEVRAYAKDSADQLTKAEFLQIWRAVAEGLSPDPEYRIGVPHLLTHGDHDKTGNVASMGPTWAKREPQCRYEVIPNASHNANQDNPESFNRVMLEFLAEHYPVVNHG